MWSFLGYIDCLQKLKTKSLTDSFCFPCWWFLGLYAVQLRKIDERKTLRIWAMEIRHIRDTWKYNSRSVAILSPHKTALEYAILFTMTVGHKVHWMTIGGFMLDFVQENAAKIPFIHLAKLFEDLPDNCLPPAPLPFIGDLRNINSHESGCPCLPGAPRLRVSV